MLRRGRIGPIFRKNAGNRPTRGGEVRRRMTLDRRAGKIGGLCPASRLVDDRAISMAEGTRHELRVRLLGEGEETRESCLRREGLPASRPLAAWDAKWHGLSPQARSTFLAEVKGPARNQADHAPSYSVSASQAPAPVLEELTAAGFVEVRPPETGATTRSRLRPRRQLYDFAARVRRCDGCTSWPPTDSRANWRSTSITSSSPTSSCGSSSRCCARPGSRTSNGSTWPSSVM